MGSFKNEFSWSWSRHRTFGQCPRMYWLNHYGFWDGWSPDCSPEVREVYIQKKLNSRAQWLGTVVHETAEWVLKSVRKGSYPPKEQVIQRAMTKAKRQIEDSQRSLFRTNPKKFPGFVEHYYRSLSEEEEDWSDTLDDLMQQLSNLFSNKVFLRLCRVPDQIVEVEDLVQIPVGDIPVWVSLDALVRDDKDGLVIIDWKTGRNHLSEQVNAQLGVYGVYALHRYCGQRISGVVPEPPKPLKAMYVNIRHGTHTTWDLDQGAMQDAVDLIQESAGQMRGQLADKDNNIAEKEDFPLLEENSPVCLGCVYRRTCNRE